MNRAEIASYMRKEKARQSGERVTPVMVDGLHEDDPRLQKMISDAHKRHLEIKLAEMKSDAKTTYELVEPSLEGEEFSEKQCLEPSCNESFFGGKIVVSQDEENWIAYKQDPCC